MGCALRTGRTSTSSFAARGPTSPSRRWCLLFLPSRESDPRWGTGSSPRSRRSCSCSSRRRSPPDREPRCQADELTREVLATGPRATDPPWRSLPPRRRRGSRWRHHRHRAERSREDLRLAREVDRLAEDAGHLLRGVEAHRVLGGHVVEAPLGPALQVLELLQLGRLLHLLAPGGEQVRLHLGRHHLLLLLPRGLLVGLLGIEGGLGLGDGGRASLLVE